MSENSRDSILQRERPKKLLELFNKHKKIVDIGIIIAISVVVFVKAFGTYDVMKYIDGGYYVLEVKTLINSGKLYYEAPPLFFIIAYLFSTITNLEIGIRIASALIVAFQVPSFFISLYLIKGRKEAYFTLPFTLWNTTFYTMYGNLSKNLMGLVFIPIILAALWKLWQKNERLGVYLVILFVGVFCLTISHLPATLVGMISTGVLVLLVVLNSLLKNYLKIPKYFGTMKKHLKDKEFKVFLSYPIVRIIIAGVTIFLSLLLGIAVDNVFPHMPSTWYSSSDMPSKDYGNADEELVLLLSRFFLILLREPVTVLVFLGILFLLRPKAWEIPVAVFIAVSAIDFSILSHSWLPRLTFDLEIGRILLYAICSGGIVDFLAKIIPKFSRKLLLSKKNVKIPKIINSKTFNVTICSIIILTTFSITNATLFSVSHDRFFISEQFLEEYSNIGEFINNSEIATNPLVYAAHGEEFWFTVETGIEAKSSTSWNNFIDLMSEITSYTERSVYLLYPKNRPPIIGTVPIISIEKWPIGGQWGHIIRPQNLTFLGDYNYSILMSFNLPPSEIKNATLTIWQLITNEEKEMVHSEVLNVVNEGTTRSRIFNAPSILQNKCNAFSWLLLSIKIEFYNPSIVPFVVILAVYGGISPFKIVNQSSFYTLFELKNNFSLMEEYLEPYPSFSPQLNPPAPPNQPPQTNISTKGTLFFDFLSPEILWPFIISENFYVKLLLSLPITIFQLYMIPFMICFLARNSKTVKS